MKRQFVMTVTWRGRQRTCLFVMTDPQMKAYDLACREIVLSSRCNRAQAEVGVEKVVTKMLGGALPTERDPAQIHRLRLAFPILKHRDVKALATIGCPDGWVTSVNLVVVTRVGVRAVRVDFDPDQAVAYNDAIAAVMALNNLSRDEAWLFVNNTIGALISGVALKEEAHEVITSLAEQFSTMNEEQVRVLPETTDQDVRDYSCRGTWDDAS